MAGFTAHMTVSTALGVGYGAAAVNPLGFSPSAGFLAAGLTAAGGMLPDLDSDTGVPVRHLFGLAAVVLPMLLVPRLKAADFDDEALLFTVGLMYLLIRYGASYLFKKVTVHRGMFHSIPAMLICGLLVYLEFHGPLRTRLLLAGGVMLGFLSHLILDEIYSVDFNGMRVRLKPSAGSAVKFFSPSIWGTGVCYGLLGGLGCLAYADWVRNVSQ
jgi:membrane-bound metal-dependent hydrolase YbcI (DUF457 family)